MKTLWSTGARREIRDRLHRLSPDAARRWGTLSAHAALVHLADSLRMAPGEIGEAPIPGMLRHQPFKWLASHVLPMPKGVKGPAGYFTTSPTDYQSDGAELGRLIDRYAEPPAEASWGQNPFFGRLSEAEWGALAYRHVDHHLRQFGGQLASLTGGAPYGYTSDIHPARKNMVTRIQKWGNSQGLRLSKELLSNANLQVGDEVEITVGEDTLTVTPVRRVRGRQDIRELVRRIPDEHRPGEIEWGPPVGREVW